MKNFKKIKKHRTLTGKLCWDNLGERMKSFKPKFWCERVILEYKFRRV